MPDIPDEAVTKAVKEFLRHDSMRAALEAALPYLLDRPISTELADKVRGLKARIRELEDGIRQHRDAPRGWGNTQPRDERLWALLAKEADRE